MIKPTYDRIGSLTLIVGAIVLGAVGKGLGWSDVEIVASFVAYFVASIIVGALVHHFAKRVVRYPVDLPAYVDRVVGYLAGEFDWDEQTQGIARRHLDNKNGYGPGFEFICDHPGSAMYRLKSLSIDDDPWALRMAYHGYNPDRGARAARVSRELRKLRYAKAVTA